LLCCRSNSEYANFGFPNKLAEYLSVGIPVIATRVGDMEQYIKDNENGFLAEPENVEDISQIMARILANPTISNQVGKKGRLVARNVFDYRNHISSLNAFIKSRIKNPIK